MKLLDHFSSYVLLCIIQREFPGQEFPKVPRVVSPEQEVTALLAITYWLLLSSLEMLARRLTIPLYWNIGEASQRCC